MEDKVIIKIMQEPKELPCSDCVKDCRGDEFMRCKKLKAHNKKIIAKEYDRQEAIEKIRVAFHQVFISKKAKRPLFLDYAEAALNALLGVEGRE